MKTLALLLTMALAAPLYAETYSWIDSNGTYNYSDDMSRVPAKYRNKVVKRGETGNKDNQPAVTPEAEAIKVRKAQTSHKEKTTPSGSGSVNEKQLYGEKSYDEWQQEFVRQEAELKQMELELAKIRQTISTGRISKEKQAAMLKEYETLQAKYKQKFSRYGELLESAKKTGLTVEMKKQVN